MSYNCNDCPPQQDCHQQDCGCPIPDLSAACVIYKGQELTCIGAEIPDTVESLLKKFDTAICSKLETILQQGDLVNVGNGIEFYKGTNNLGQREIRSLTSSDNSITINLDPNNEEVDITFDGETFTLERESTTADAQVVSTFDSVNERYTFKGLKGLNDVTIGTDADGNITFDVDVPNQNITLTSPDNSAIITEPTLGNYEVEVNFPSQQQSDVLESDVNSPAFINNQNPVKVVAATTSGALTYELIEADNNKVILLDCTNNNIIVNIPSTLPDNNYFVGFLQKGTNTVNFTGYDIKPSGFEDEIQGEGHNAAVERIASNSYLLGALKETP